MSVEAFVSAQLRAALERRVRLELLGLADAPAIVLPERGPGAPAALLELDEQGR